MKRITDVLEVATHWRLEISYTLAHIKKCLFRKSARPSSTSRP
jgi:hypothetical protein